MDMQYIAFIEYIKPILDPDYQIIEEKKANARVSLLISNWSKEVWFDDLQYIFPKYKNLKVYVDILLLDIKKKVVWSCRKPCLCKKKCDVSDNSCAKWFIDKPRCWDSCSNYDPTSISWKTSDIVF